MKFIAMKTDKGAIRGKILFYCRILKVTRQGFYYYLGSLLNPYKYENLVALMIKIIDEDECNDTYGSKRMRESLILNQEITGSDLIIPSQRTIARIMKQNGLIHKRKRTPNSLTKEDKEAQKSDDLLKRDFQADEPQAKCVTDITEVPTVDGKLYVAAVEDCFNNEVLGLSIADNMRAGLCVDALTAAVKAHPGVRGSIVHSDRGSQFTSVEYRAVVKKYHIMQSMNSASGRCHDNAKCESLWGRFKEEQLYNRYKTETMRMSEVKSLIWRYFMSYWNNRRICSANGGLPPVEKRRRYYMALDCIA
jgi:transposase InsO family protein